MLCISAPCAEAAMIEDYLDRPAVAGLVEIEGGVARLINVAVPLGGDVVGTRIKDIAIPANAW